MAKGKLGKLIPGICYWLCLYLPGYAQTPVRQFDEKHIDTTFYSRFLFRKDIPDTIKYQALLTLSFYPELKDLYIMLRQRQRKTPLTSRPRISSVFRKKMNRRYLITISTKSSEELSPILFGNLPFNAQIGVLGHELAHISDYNSKSSLQLIGDFLGLLDSGRTDRFEYNTDLICINHGLGYQLYDWSRYVRSALHINQWRGVSDGKPSKGKDVPKERYMDPETIEAYIHANPIYRQGE